MAAFRIFSQLNTFIGQSLQFLPGGYLKFYEAGTTTPKDVYGEEALETNNGPQIALDASSRPTFDIWGEGSYFVELYDADDVKQGEADDCEIPGGGGLTIPALSGNSGKYLTNNGSILLWNAVREVPDPTGQSGKVLGNDGSNLLWQAAPTAPIVPPLPTEGVVQGATSLQAGKWKEQTGTFTAPASGGSTTTVSVVFPTAYSGNALHFSLTIHGGGHQSGGPVVWYLTSPASGTGATIEFDIAEGASASPNFGTAVTGTWKATGIIP